MDCEVIEGTNDKFWLFIFIYIFILQMRPKNYKVKNGVSNNTLNLIKAVDKKLNQQSFKVCIK